MRGSTRAYQSLSVPDAMVTGYEHLIELLDLPDRDDRHVLAAAFRCGADVIVTVNLDYFPTRILRSLGIVTQVPMTLFGRSWSRLPSSCCKQ